LRDVPCQVASRGDVNVDVAEFVALPGGEAASEPDRVHFAFLFDRRDEAVEECGLAGGELHGTDSRRRRQTSVMPDPIRRARPEDAERLACVHLRARQQAYARLIPASYLDGLMDGLAERTELWRRLMSETSPWVAESVAGEIVGFALFGASRDEDATPGVTGEIGAIYVLADHWDRSVGRELMRAA